MSPPTKTTNHVPDPAIAINSLLRCAEDCMERAGGVLDPQTFGAIDAAYVDQQLFRATTFISKARAIAVSQHGVPGLIGSCAGDSWHPDDVLELAPVAGVNAETGGAK